MQTSGTLPHRPVQWRRAMRALWRMQGNYDSRLIMDYASALEGDEGERGFQDFRAQPGAAQLERDRPSLAALMDDWDRLSQLPSESLGRAYLALARRDQIRVGDLVAGAHALPDERERAPDPLRRWYRDRMTAMHDLLHVLTGYGRDRAGELQLIAFTLGIASLRVLRIAIVLGPFAAPPRAWPGLVLDLWRAWRRGARSQISRATAWEMLLPLPIADVQARLGVAPERVAHPLGVWRESERGKWLRASRDGASGDGLA
jgi:ubiquinone biosynthesis protein COQ4